MREAAHVIVSGLVQGVGFRFWTERNARELALSGWVRNLYDGRVEIFAEGEPAAVGALIDRCRRGPRSAEVSAVSAVRVEASGAATFAVRRDAEAPEGFERT